jgi:uncharacterized membrane protein YgcG
MLKTSFFLFIFLFSLPLVYGETMQAYLLAPGEESFTNDEIVLTNDETLDLDPITVFETTETIGGQEVELTQEVKIVADDSTFVSLRNTALTNVIVAIPDNTIVKAPAAWNGEITPPKSISTSGSVAAGFQTPSTSIQVGSPDVILVFDKAVTILLTGTTGQTAYKTPGANTWISISSCSGTYAAPADPAANGECSISNGVDTKIVAFHFTEFAGLSATPAPSAPAAASTSTSGNSGGHGRTGVGPSSSGGSSGSSGYSGPGLVYDIPEKPIIPGLPKWFNSVIIWQQQGLISTDEMLQAWKWLKAQ